jgi:outer membrane receptor protein involved in Fe transport
MLVGGVWLCAAGTAWSAEDQDLFDLSLEELMAVTITTASRSAERLSDAPATVIVISRDELNRRGYRELSEIFDDLPGMDVSRAYGDNYFRNQWRGLRGTIGTPWLLMLDGVIFNHLYFNQAEIIAALPMSVIEQVEVVYGPASAVYGANAVAGVVNVITRSDREEEGYSLSGQFSAGAFATRSSDLHLLWRHGDWRLSLAGRHARADLDQDRNADYEYTRERYLQDRQLWGGFVDRYGRYAAPRTTRGADLRLHYRQTELAVQYFSLDTHYGLVYPTDRIPTRGYWSEPDLSVHLRHAWSRGTDDQLSGTLLLRYRESGVASDSDYAESFEGSDPLSGRPTRLVNYSYWGVETHSWSAFHDMQWRLDERNSLLAGLKHERKNLQKAYRINFGPNLPATELDRFDDYPLPPRADFDSIPFNRIDTRDSAAYFLFRHRRGGEDGAASHQWLAGVRFDHNSHYGTARTLRGGYVWSRAPLTFKLLYGESFNEPAPRELYGGWTGSGSDPDLSPELSRTLEASLSWTGRTLTTVLSAYHLSSEDNIATFAGGATNLGDRTIRGADLHLHARLPVGEQTWSLWAYYSYLDALESRPEPDAQLVEGPVGDTARHKLYAGLSVPFDSQRSLTLRARYIGERMTVPTNPVRIVPGYTTVDLSFRLRDWPAVGSSWSLTATNLLDRRYFHPGLREANAGVTPGVRRADGRWQGSAGYYNSLLPQEGRGIFLGWQLEL